MNNVIVSQYFLTNNKHFAALFFVLMLWIISNSASANFCVLGQVKEVGTWINPDINTGGITKAVFTEVCVDDSSRWCNADRTLCSISQGVKLAYKARLWGKCHPTDCDWGTVEGVYTSAKWLRFSYDQGFAKRMVWAQVWSDDSNWLRLIVDTDFDSPDREDYRFDKWMKRK